MIKVFKELSKGKTNKRAGRAKYLFYTVIWLFMMSSLNAANDSLPKKTPKIIPIIKYFCQDAFDSTDTKRNLQKMDTVLDAIEIFNPVFRKNYKYNGNLGSPAGANIFGINNHLGADLGHHNFDIYFFNLDSIKYYRTNMPFTELAVELGSQGEGLLKITHTQTIKERFNFGLNYNRIGSDGYLLNGITKLTNFDFFTWYNSKNQRYNVLFSGIWNTIKNQENGGLKNDSLITSGGLNDVAPSASDIHLTNAVTRTSNRVLFLKQFYDLGYKYDEKINDSTSLHKFKPSQRISHSIAYETDYYVFEDSLELPGYYNNFYYNPAKTYDSTHFSKIENKVEWRTLANKNNPEDSIRKMLYSLELTHEFIKFQQQNIDSSMQNGMVGGSIKMNTEHPLLLKGEYCFAGANKGAYTSSLRLGRSDFSKSFIAVQLEMNSISPSLLQARYDGNNYAWSNNFSRTRSQIATLSFYSKPAKTMLDLRILNIYNYIYLNQDAMPTQRHDSLAIAQVDLTKNFIWNHLHFNNHLIYQLGLNSDLVRLPKFMTINSLFMDGWVFKHALQAQIGVDFRYNSSYYGDAYTPVTGQYYQQNRFAIGNYPLLDLFLNLRIRTARIFVRGENMLNLFHTTRAYYLVPGYPMPTQCLKFGVIWDFFD